MNILKILALIPFATLGLVVILILLLFVIGLIASLFNKKIEGETKIIKFNKEEVDNERD